MKVLVIDVGGTHIKVAGSWDRVTHRIPSGPDMTAEKMVRGVLDLTKTWDYEAVSLGYPGPVKDNRPFREPVNIGGGWTNLDFQKAFGKPVKCINDAAMQALGSFAGGRMLFLGLGTGLGTSIVEDWRVEPLEIAHLPYRKGKSYEEYLGDAGLAELGDERWEKHVHRVCDLFRAALLCDGIVLGGGNARKLVNMPEATTRGSNENAILGGVRLWERVGPSAPKEFDHAAPAPSATRRRAGGPATKSPTKPRRASSKKSATKSAKKSAKKLAKKSAKKSAKRSPTKSPRTATKTSSKRKSTRRTSERASTSTSRTAPSRRKSAGKRRA